MAFLMWNEFDWWCSEKWMTHAVEVVKVNVSNKIIGLIKCAGPVPCNNSDVHVCTHCKKTSNLNLKL